MTTDPDHFVIIHNREHVHTAIRLSRETGHRIGLVSARNAASFMGVAWWMALTHEILDTLAPQERPPALLDCGSSAGYAAQAIRMGHKDIILSDNSPQLSAITLLCTANGVRLRTTRPNCFDLGVAGAPQYMAHFIRMLCATPSGA